MTEEISLITFLLGDKNFAVTIDEVQEIASKYEIISVPNTPPFIEGIVNLRGTILPVLDLSKKIGFNLEAPYKNLLVVKFAENILAIKVSGIVGVLNIKKSNIEEFPLLLTTQINKKYLKGIIKKKEISKKDGKIQEKEILIFIFSLAKILDLDEQATLIKSTAIIPVKKEDVEEDEIENTMRLATFFLNSQCFGLSISLVQEILELDINKITTLPYLSSCFLGVINLRGNILWVIDIREFLGLPPLDTNNNTGEVIVIQHENKFVGIFVDKIGKIENFSLDCFQPAPTTLEGTKAEFIKGQILTKEQKQFKTTQTKIDLTQEIKENIKTLEVSKTEEKDKNQIIVVLDEDRIFKLSGESNFQRIK